MSLDLRDCSFSGPALPEPFVRFQLEDILNRKKRLPKANGADGKALQSEWEPYRRKLIELGDQGGEVRVRNHVLEPLLKRLGWASLEKSESVVTREGEEDGGFLFTGTGTEDRLRAWVYPVGADLDAPNKRGRAYRFSPSMVAQRVLLTRGERVGLLTDGTELRIVFSDPSGKDSHIAIRLDRSGGWRGARTVPDSYRLLRALCEPAGTRLIADLVNDARLAQATVTKKLREQARKAVEGFIQGLLDDPENAGLRQGWSIAGNKEETNRLTAEAAKQLWREGLIFVYRLLFILKLESSADPARAFSFATSSLWKNSFSPSIALARAVEERKAGHDTGTFLVSSLRSLFRLFSDGMRSVELNVSPLGGMLFGKEATPLLDGLHWNESAVADLLDALLWTPPEKKKGRDDQGRERVHYGALDVEDLGRVYEALLELDPGVSSEPMCRLRRAKLEVVVPLAQGARYRGTKEPESEEDESETEEDDAEESKGKTKVVFAGEIPANAFYLRVGLGRKATGSYYTPHPFVKFLVEETLGPQIKERSPSEDPQPAAILGLKVLDPAMGSGHFLVEACRFLALALYEACRLCDERAAEAEREAEAASGDAATTLLQRAQALRKRVEDLPDPNDEMLAYLPSRITDAEIAGVSQQKALALCRRLVAVHCLYGVDKNPLAVELARVSLWLESYAEGLPLTFLEHRLVQGDSLTGPMLSDLFTFPDTGEAILISHEMSLGLRKIFSDALQYVRALEATVGKDVADIQLKKDAKANLDAALAPLKTLAAAWAGGAMLGHDVDHAGYTRLLAAVEKGEELGGVLKGAPVLTQMVALGEAGVPYDLRFPEVFHPNGDDQRTGGFHALIGNPPWDTLQPLAAEFFSSYDLRVLDAPTKKERRATEERLLRDDAITTAFNSYVTDIEQRKRIILRLCKSTGKSAGGEASGATLDLWQPFADRSLMMLRGAGYVGMVLPSAFHANQGATGIRHAYLSAARLLCCYSFENKRKLFEIHPSFKFAAIVAMKDPRGTSSFLCAFYRHELEWLNGSRQGLQYTRAFIEATGRDYFTFPELRTLEDMDIAIRCSSIRQTYGELCARVGVRTGEELHMTKSSHLFVDVGSLSQESPRDHSTLSALRSRGYVPLHEGKTFHQFQDAWDAAPRYFVSVASIADKPAWVSVLRFYRLAIRTIASSTNERTVIAFLAPPGSLFGHSASPERQPEGRPNWVVLSLIALLNSFTLDWSFRQRGGSNVNLFVLSGCSAPQFSDRVERFVVHSALRLSCNHGGYAPLWSEQLGEAWRETRSRFDWPALADDTRWVVRAKMDALIASAYGLDRKQYEHVLSSFSHKSYPEAPTLCLAGFDELQSIGMDAFVKRHDPYFDIPLVTTPARPVIDLSVPEESAPTEGPRKPRQMQLVGDDGPLFGASPATSRRRPA